MKDESETDLIHPSSFILHPSGANPQGSDADGPRFLVVRLSALIFLAFAILGAWVPVFSLHLKNLNFSPEATAWASAASAIGALIAPILWGQIADRWLAMQRCISLCALASGAGLWILAELREPETVILVSIALWFFLIPTIGLSTSLIFRQLEHPERGYGKIRMWGTLGWVAASWCLTLWFALFAGYADADGTADFADSLRLGGLAAILLALYALTLPHTPPGKCLAPLRTWYGRLADAPLSALLLFHDRSFVVYCVCMFGFNITLPFTIQLNPLLLAQLGVNAARLPLYLTIAQSTEVIFLYCLPMLLMRFGTKPIMLLGGMSWTLGLALLSVGSPVWLVLASLVTAGVFICCFFIAGQVYVNRQATHDIRASAQGMLLFISGSGLLLGHLLVGWIRDWTDDRYGIAYLGAFGLAALLVVFFLVGFSSTPSAAISPQEILVPDSEIT
jgi:MFS family permease